MERERIQVKIGLAVSDIEKYRSIEIERLQKCLAEAIADFNRRNEIDDWERWIEETKNAAPEELVQYMFEDSWKQFYKKQMGWV